MRDQGGPVPLPSDDPSDGFAIDLTVPYADSDRDHVLRERWRRQAGDAVPPPPLRLPRHSEGAYRVRIRLQVLGDIRVEDQYSDAVAGSTGGAYGHHEDLVMAHLTVGGEWRFSSGRRTAAVGAGLLCARRNDEPWDFTVARGTRATALGLPARDIRFPARTNLVMAEHRDPAVRLLLAHLRGWAEVADSLGPAASATARAAAVELFHGVLNDQVVDDPPFSPALVRAATEYVESRLTDPDLDPRAIAAALHVSVRTLHRAFAQEATSVMGLVRARRLDRARAELLATPLSVSELAARWHFTDSSHFIRAFRARFGRTPRALRRT
ncbi:AraC family transcriptional regulator [Streptomyces sp. B3I8]|uniref:helix-turn-helix transcriptional regulator n=1 Tax=Streptomyces sp. B3I8 TaxID=3042303 RepID=UPI00278A4FB5|nr:AraC family transcriptional regulator [Streptomyces sp. B3I8]MDQ0791290.1 AraC-like DNA-binding protein [Streptomyces sp. B3I8]